MRVENEYDLGMTVFHNVKADQQSKTVLPKSIFSISENEWGYPGIEQNRIRVLDEKTRDPRVGDIFSQTTISKNGSQVGGKVKATISWGGKEPPQKSLSAEGSVKDKHGNKGSAEVKVDQDGRKTASVEVSKDPEDSNKNKKKQSCNYSG